MLPRPTKVLHKVIAKSLPRHASLPHHPLRRRAQILRQPLPLVTRTTYILAFPQRRDGDLEFLLDAAPAEADDGREDEEGVCICARDADLEAGGFGWGDRWGDQSDRGGAVFKAPGDGDGGPEVLDEPFVRIDGRSDDGHDVREPGEDAGKEVAAEVGDVGKIWVRRVRVLIAAVEHVLAGFVHDGHMHVATVSGEAVLRFCHEAGCCAMSAADALDYIFEEAGTVGHVSDLAVFEGCFEDARSGLGVPAFNVGGEAFASGEDVVVPGLVVDGAGEGVAGHAFGQMGKRVRWVLLDEGGCAGSIERRLVGIIIWRGAKLVELIFSCME